MNPRSYAINVLRMWWDASLLGQLRLSSFQDALAYYDRTHPSFMEEFGRAAKSVSTDKARSAMEKVARESGSNYPDIGTFFNALGQAAQTWNGDDTRAIVEGTISDLQGSLKFGLGTVVIIGAVLAGVWVWQAFGGAPQRARA